MWPWLLPSLRKRTQIFPIFYGPRNGHRCFPIHCLQRQDNQSNSVRKGSFVIFSDSWKSLETSLRGCSRMLKELQLLAGVSGCQVQHMAERCLVPNQANGSKTVRGPPEGARSITQHGALHLSPKSREAAF